MAKALTQIRHDGQIFAAGEEVVGLTEEQEKTLQESGALEGGDFEEEDDEPE